MRMKKNLGIEKRDYKVGDRIFFEYWDDKSIGEAVVRDIEHRSYDTDDGGTIEFNFLHTGSHTAIEDYNCIPEDDPRVVEYKKTHDDPRNFEEKFMSFMKENNFDIHNGVIQNYLYELIN